MADPDLADLEGRLLGPDQKVRREAVADVVAVGGEHAARLLEAGTQHWDRGLRQACALALVRSQGAARLPFLRRLVEERRISLAPAVALTVELRSPALCRALFDEAAAEEPGRFVRALVRELVKLDDAQDALRESALARREDLVGRARAREARRADRLRVLDTAALDAALGLGDGTFGMLFRYWRWDHGTFDECYSVTRIPKRRGGFRVIAAPQGHLLRLQRAILDTLLAPVRLSDACHGFRAGRSIGTNALPHVGHELVVNVDLRDFFHTVTSGRVAGLFDQLELPGGVVGRAFLVDAVTRCGHLPQGAPTSPAIANLVCRRLDSRLLGLARVAGASYTRYADDLTISGPAPVASLLPPLRAIVQAEGFTIAKEKTRLLRRGVRQDVTGLTVNEQVSVPRALRRRLRAAVHGAAHGRTPTWKGRPLTSEQLRGHLAYLRSLHPDEAARLSDQLDGTRW